MREKKNKLKCINCGEIAWGWFCQDCIRVKENSYAQSAKLNENYIEVITRRDRNLREYAKNKIKI